MTAGRAPGGPEVQHHHLAAKVGERDLVARRRRRRLSSGTGLGSLGAKLNAAAGSGMISAASASQTQQTGSHAGHPLLGTRIVTRQSRTAPDGAVALWGGHFERGPAPLMEQINASIGFDKRLYAHDIAGSKAHAAMLAAGRHPERGRARRHRRRPRAHPGRDRGGRVPVQRRARRHPHEHRGAAHRADRRARPQAAHRALAQRPGRDRLPPVGARRDRSHRSACCKDLQAALLARAEEHAAAVMPGFTHLQAAQPVTLGHHLHGLRRDVRAGPGPLRRRAGAAQRMPARRGGARRHELPDRSRPRPPRRSASTRPCANSIDAVSDRDFALEFLAAAAIAATHLSRLAEELVLWSTPAVRLRRMAEEFSSGSSIMPQKRNPDAAELVRGKAGRVIGEPDGAAGRAQGPAARLRQGPAGGQGAGVRCRRQPGPLPGRDGRYDQRDDLDRDRLAAAAAVGYTTATDLADWLVRRAGRAVPRGASRRRARRCAGPRSAASAWPASISPICRRSSRGSRPRCSRC